MRQYLDLVQTVMKHGIHKPNRTGIDTISFFAYPFRHDLRDGFPLLTTKKMDGPLWNSMVHELLWFLSGENHIRNFRQHSSIWDAWADEYGNLETAYGFYWRNYPYVANGRMVHFAEDPYHVYDISQTVSYEVGNFDQLGWCIEEIKRNPNSRRLIVNAWEPWNAHKSKLPPCHLLYIFNVQDGRLCLHLTQRSCDIFLGVPFNIASYALLTHIVAQEVGLEPGILSISFVDAHIYVADADDRTMINGHPRCEYDHLHCLEKQIKRPPFPLPKVQIANKPMAELKFEDIELLKYQSHPRLKARVAV